MAQTLNYNSAVMRVAAVPLPSFDADLDIIQKLDDEPNDVGGMTAAELKAEFDAAGNRTKEYINNELIPAVIADGLTEETRAAAESERVANEIERVVNEDARIAAEERRTSADIQRDSAETDRQTAESARAAAEQARVDTTTGIVARATEQANAAAASASEAQSYKTAASGSASAAAASATAAAASSSDASSAASAASSNANAASASATAARAAQIAAEKARDEAKDVAGGDYATISEVQGYANAAEANANKYTDQKFATIPTPDVSGQIESHNTSTSAHSDIREAVAAKAPMYTYGTDDLEAGVTALETGKLHFVYE